MVFQLLDKSKKDISVGHLRLFVQAWYPHIDTQYRVKLHLVGLDLGCVYNGPVSFRISFGP